MEYRRLGASGFRVPVLSLGTGTFGGQDAYYKQFGSTDVAEARRLVDICMEAGVSMFDSADTYSAGAAEEILGQAIKGHPRDSVIISTKATLRVGDAPNGIGSSRFHLIDAVEKALRRLDTDYIDLFQLHAFDAMTPQEEVLSTLDQLVRVGKIRYTGVSNFSAWHLMKSLSVADRYGYPRHIAHQAYYSLLGRDYEWELMPVAQAEGVGAVVWSPLGFGRLSGKLRRGQALPEVTRLNIAVDSVTRPSDEFVYKVVDALDLLAAETGKTVAQIALNWILQRPTVSSLIIGARNEEQLRQNLGTLGWNLTPEQVRKLDETSAVPAPYPHWYQSSFAERDPRLV